VIAYDQTLYTFELLDNEPKRKEKNLKKRERRKIKKKVTCY